MDTTLTGFKYLVIVILIVIVILVVLDKIGQKTKRETLLSIIILLVNR
jgi:hypothetical protein